MSLYLAVFSPTGRTLKAVKAVSEVFGEGKIIDLCAPKGKFKGMALDHDDILFCAAPSFSGRMPQTAARRIKMITGNKTDAVLLASYGNRDYEDVLVEMEDLLVENGFVIKAAVSAVTEHSINRSVSQGRPDAKDLKELQNFGKVIREQIESDYEGKLKLPGKRPYKPLKAHFPFVPMHTSDCTACGRCRECCPTGAISDALETDSAVCVSCLRCMAVCPAGARVLDKNLVDGVGNKLGILSQKENELFLEKES